MNFKQKIEKIIKKNNSLLCIGLDPDLEKIPKHLLKNKDPIFSFNKAIIDATHDLVCAFKPNIAFYEAYGIDGLKSLKKTIYYLKTNFGDISVILDAKRGDVGNTAKMYAKAIFDYWMVDAVTVNPYLGYDAIEPFFKYKNKGIIILCRTSNPDSSNFQELKVSIDVHLRGVASKQQQPLYLAVAKKVVDWNKIYHNCLLTIGATYPLQLKEVRTIAQGMFFLIPGIGRQGGDLKNTLKHGLTKQKSGLIISVSRSILYATNVRNEAKEIRDKINKYRHGQ